MDSLWNRWSADAAESADVIPSLLGCWSIVCLQSPGADIEQQTDLKTRSLQVRKRLDDNYFYNLRFRLNLHHDFFDHKIHPLLANDPAAIRRVNPYLAAVV